MKRCASTAVVWLLMCAHSPALAAGVDEVRAELQSLGEALDDLERRYLAPALLERDHKITARLSDGQLFFLTQDYDRAAMVLLDVIENPRANGHPGYRDALYYLAESLFRTRNYKAAVKWFEQVSKRGNADQKQEAVGRLLEIAVLTEDVDAARNHLARAGQLLSAQPDPRLVYAVGKYHYRVNELVKSRAMFERVPAEHGSYIRARYFLGVLDVRERKIEQGIAAFETVIKATVVGDPPDPADLQIQDQARLAVARLYYELGKFDEAVGGYSSVNRDSPAFDEAMFESVWISVKQQDYEKALRRLEILLISQASALKGPDARLLKGKLLMMLERYDDAAQAFQEVLFEFGPVQAEMRQIVQQNRGDLVAYFNRVIGKNIAEFDLASFLPTRAAEFAGPDVSADRALLLVADLAAQKRDLDEAERTVRRIGVAIDAPNRIEIFPKLHEGWLKATEARSRVAVALGQLNEVAARGLGSSSGYAQVRDARRGWAERYAGVPKSAIEIRARDARLDDEMVLLAQEAHRLGLEIRGLEAQLVAIDKYIQDTAGDMGRLPKEEAALAQVERELRQTTAMRDQLVALQEQLEGERISIGVNDGASGRDEDVRRSFLDAVNAEARFLGTNGAAVPAVERQQLEGLERRAESFLQRARQLVDERIAEIRGVLDRERTNVANYTSSLTAYQGETESLGGSIAARSFRHVLDRIDAVVLEADVGLVDVAWKQKEDRSRQISAVLERQSDEQAELKRNFEEVTGEE